jgi:diaminopimelate dehydrogenase
MRLYMDAALPVGQSYTFYGKGVSQGHSEAIRGIDGVENAVQYSLPADEAIERIRNGETPVLATRERIKRLCYVAVFDDADKARVEKEIKDMPDYFSDYDTEVIFVSNDELKKNHGMLPHGGHVLHRGSSGGGNSQLMEFSLKLESNPAFTAGVLLMYARAAHRLHEKGECGARTVLDIPPVLLSGLRRDELFELI